MPKGDGSVPGVVLVHGSGPSDMDESIGPNKPFRDLAWGLASRGVAVLRYDKRTAACDVDLASLTMDEKITNDALAALSVLREHERVRAGDTVVVGHSIGGMVTPRIASRDDSLAGAAMLAANARPLAALYPDQYQYLVSLDGTVTGAERDRLESVRTAVERVRSLDIDEGEVVLGLGGRPFWRSVQRYDQVAVAKRLDLPLFVLQGGRDYQVRSERDFQRWKDALSGQEDVRFQSYPDLNHLFMSGSGKPSPTEYFRSNKVAKTVVEDLATWVHSVTGD